MNAAGRRHYAKQALAATLPGKPNPPSGHNRHKTHCFRGHPLAGENLYINPSGGRTCRTCQAESRPKYRRQRDAIPVVTAEQLRALLCYDAETGLFTRLTGKRAGMTAGTPVKKGHVSIKVDAASYLAHRLAWLYVYGEWPAGIVDHINRRPDDNRIANLRIVTNSQNLANRKQVGKSNTSGYKGVCYTKRYPNRPWVANIGVNNQRLIIGRFATAEEAARAYNEAARMYFGEYSALNVIAQAASE